MNLRKDKQLQESRRVQKDEDNWGPKTRAWDGRSTNVKPEPGKNWKWLEHLTSEGFFESRKVHKVKRFHICTSYWGKVGSPFSEKFVYHYTIFKNTGIIGYFEYWCINICFLKTSIFSTYEIRKHNRQYYLTRSGKNIDTSLFYKYRRKILLQRYSLF